jgi:uncharacterized protein (TIGR02391 family)
MSKRWDYPEPRGPTISLHEGRRRFEVMRDKAKVMLANRPLNESAVQTWTTSCINYIQETFGEGTSHLDTFIGPIRIRPSRGDYYDQYAEQEDAEKLQKRINALQSLIELVDTELGFATAPTKAKEDFWRLLHPAVTQVAKPRFEAGHYADAVEAALKDLNSKIKAYVRKTSGQEFDGSDLMQRAFSPNAPIVRLADLSTEDGRNIQKGYMQIFAGTMTGIRNPKAHSNVAIDTQRAVHHLHLVSLLTFIFDERL